jgi:asparagine synthase (glutamine-hydrolysing)
LRTDNLYRGPCELARKRSTALQCSPFAIQLGVAAIAASQYSARCATSSNGAHQRGGIVCGFVGGTEPQWDYGAALQAIAHRGPDASKLVRGAPITVGFRRLSIIDLSDEANQPMAAANGTWLVFNGEIYGYKVLRKELEQLGHRFHTTSDTEVVLNAFLQWGDGFVERIDGMFAIAIWDASRQALKLFRDRPGIKPLYYFHDGRRFAFASELKAIETVCGPHSLSVDETALYDFLSYRYVPAPKTLYRRCFKLPPAHKLVFDPATGALDGPRRYWAIAIPERPAAPPIDECCEQLRALIDSAVADQMVADVPVGFFLSGGIDSSVVVAAAAGLGRNVSTFSIGFDADDVSETPYARAVAGLFRTDHHERILSQAHAQELLPRLKEWFDEPFADESAMPTYLVSQAAREHVTVVLTGDGGDEVFGGYRTYPRFARYDRWPSWPPFMNTIAYALRRPFNRRSAIARVSTLLETAFNRGPELWGRIMGGLPAAAKRSYARAFGVPRDYDDWWHYREAWRDDLPLRTRLQLVDFHTFLPGLVLTKVDRTSMAVSLEARVPLLDRRIIEFAFSLPEEVRYFAGQPKGLLRRAYRGILPDNILDRRKKGFGIPRYYLKDLGGGKVIQEHVLRSLYLPS